MNFVVLYNMVIWFSQVHIQLSKSVDIEHKSNIERRVFIRGRPIVVREIVTLI